MTSREMKIFKKHNFGNTGSLLKVEINGGNKNLATKWDTIAQVFRFRSTDLCPKIEEYSKILRVHYNRDLSSHLRGIKISNCKIQSSRD